MEKRILHGNCCQKSRGHVYDRSLHFAGLAARKAADAHQARNRLNYPVDAWLLFGYSLLPISRNAAIDQIGLKLARHIVSQPKHIHYHGPETFNQDEIGSASCRGREGQDVKISVVAAA